MASGFPLVINGVRILSSEALYQACRYPHIPDVQSKIIFEKSPMSAKMVGKPFRDESRYDWNDVRIKVMRWCLRVKLAQNFLEFGRVLESTFSMPIVEDSRKDDFWGAIRNKGNENVLRGTNALGRLLMELRQLYNENRYSYEIFYIEPLNIPNFKLLGSNIEPIDERRNFIKRISSQLQLPSAYNNVVESRNNILNEPVVHLKSENESSSFKTKKLIKPVKKEVTLKSTKKKTKILDSGDSQLSLLSCNK